MEEVSAAGLAEQELPITLSDTRVAESGCVVPAVGLGDAFSTSDQVCRLYWASFIWYPADGCCLRFGY